MIKKPTPKTQQKSHNHKPLTPEFSTRVDEHKPVLVHLNEMRKRFAWIAISLLVGSTVAYYFHSQLIHIVRRPLGQTLYFTSPAGGLNFLIKLCVTFGIIFMLPVFFYQIIKFFFPLLEKQHKRAVFPYVFASLILAYGGVVFAYFVSLPNALHFLSEFGGDGIAALITADEYYSFVLTYLLGFALLFQIPIVILFINRIKPMRPGGMMGAQRYIILASFVVAAILTPTPDPINQTIMALPAVLLYQVAVFLVWRVNAVRNDDSVIMFTDIPHEIVYGETSEPELGTYMEAQPAVDLLSDSAHYLESLSPIVQKAPSEMLPAPQEESQPKRINVRQSSPMHSRAVRSMDIIVPSSA